MNEDKDMKIEIMKDGPYLVSYKIPLYRQSFVDDNYEYAKFGLEEKLENNGKCALCRCGNTEDAPFCDGTHAVCGFNGKETADRRNYFESSVKLTGPGLIMNDREDLCFGSGFCYSKEGNTWGLTQDSGNPDSREKAVEQACSCPSGRLVACDKYTKEPIEKKVPKSITVVEEERKCVSGPLFVRGGIQVVSCDGFKYEKRSRVALCRCGMSRNKPFCDGSHVSGEFRAKSNDND